MAAHIPYEVGCHVTPFGWMTHGLGSCGGTVRGPRVMSSFDVSNRALLEEAFRTRRPDAATRGLTVLEIP